MTDDLSTLRDALASSRRHQRFYPDHLRTHALAVARSLGASFRSCSLAAKQLGLPPATVRCWLKASPRQERIEAARTLGSIWKESEARLVSVPPIARLVRASGLSPERVRVLAEQQGRRTGLPLVGVRVA